MVARAAVGAPRVAARWPRVAGVARGTRVPARVVRTARMAAHVAKVTRVARMAASVPKVRLPGG